MNAVTNVNPGYDPTKLFTAPERPSIKPSPLAKGFASREEYEKYAKWILESATELMLLAHINPKAIPRACKAIEAKCRRKADKEAFVTIRKKPNPATYLMGMERTLIPILERALADGS